MVNWKNILDYFVLVPLVVSIIYYRFGIYQYKSLLVYFSFLIFFSYWTIKIVFNPKLKENLS